MRNWTDLHCLELCANITVLDITRLLSFLYWNKSPYSCCGVLLWQCAQIDIIFWKRVVITCLLRKEKKIVTMTQLQKYQKLMKYTKCKRNVNKHGGHLIKTTTFIEKDNWWELSPSISYNFIIQLKLKQGVCKKFWYQTQTEVSNVK